MWAVVQAVWRGDLGVPWYVVATVALPGLAWLTGTIRYIPNNRVGIVEKLWSLAGSVEAGLIALRGEAGYQPRVLRGGPHFMVPLQ